MSIRLMTRAWGDAPYQGTQLLVLLALCDYANDDGECWPSIDSLAAKARCSVQYVRRSLKTFASDHVLEVGKGDLRGSYTYRLTLETEFPETEVPEPLAPLPGTFGADPGPYIEPSENRQARAPEGARETEPASNNGSRESVEPDPKPEPKPTARQRWIAERNGARTGRAPVEKPLVGRARMLAEAKEAGWSLD